MNNLTPLQALTAQIYCARLGGLSSKIDVTEIYSDIVLEQSINQAKAILEATKPEPLEWKHDSEYFSKGGEFVIKENDSPNQDGEIAYYLKYLNNQWCDDEEAILWFHTLDKAKQFAEHIRTR
jgi:hypothetical protein